MNISKQDKYDEVWDEFKNNGYVSPDYLINYENDDKSKKTSSVINRFTDNIEIGDIFIAHKGVKNLVGIGIVESDCVYENNLNLRYVKWFYLKDITFDNTFFAVNDLVHLSDYHYDVNKLICMIAYYDKMLEIIFLNLSTLSILIWIIGQNIWIIMKKRKLLLKGIGQ